MDRYQRYKASIDRANNKYKKANIKRVVLQLNRSTDGDLIQFIESLDNIQGEIKKIIRRYINDNSK